MNYVLSRDVIIVLKMLKVLFICVAQCLMVSADSSFERLREDRIRENFGDIYMGEPFLTS